MEPLWCTVRNSFPAAAVTHVTRRMLQYGFVFVIKLFGWQLSGNWVRIPRSSGLSGPAAMSQSEPPH